METKANYTLVGLFTLAVIAAGFGFVFWFSSTGDRGDRVAYRVVFDGAVSGLRTGGSVLFNGIKVGEVTDLKLNPQDPKQAIATVAIDKSIALREDTRANLEFQGLTGIAAISLKGGQSDARPLTGDSGELPTILAEPSAVQDVLQGAREIMGRADSVMRRVDAMLADNEAPLRNMLHNADRFMGALGDNADEVSAFMKDAAGAARRIAALSDNIDKLAADLDGLVKAVDTQKVGSVVENIETFSKGLAGSADKMTAFFDDARAAAGKLNDMSARLDTSLARVGEIVTAVEPARIQRTVENVDKFSTALGDNSGKVDALLKDTAEIARKFAEMTPRLDRVLANVEGLTGSQSGPGLMAEITDTARSFRQLSDNLDKRTAEMSAGLSRFTGSGLREWQALATDGRRALAELSRAVRNFDRNPQRVLFGASSGDEAAAQTPPPNQSAPRAPISRRR